MTVPMKDALTDLDPFDLPDWLGTAEVTWTSETGVRAGHHVAGRLHADGAGSTVQDVACDLLAIDEAYPEPVADDDLRHMAHQAWKYGEVLLVTLDDRMTLAVPGTSFTADLVLDALARFAKAVGARPESFSVLLRLGG